MKTLIILIALMTMGASQAAGPLTQFDLLCELSPAANPRGNLPPERLRIDLTRNEWCIDDGGSMTPLTTTEEELVLRDERSLGDPPIERKITVNRRSAQIHTYVHVGQLSPSNTMQECSVAPFTGPTALPLF